jgi:SAM-dependent methyltransferase
MKIEFLSKKVTYMKDIFGWDVGTWSKAISIWKECIEKNNYKKGLEIGNAFGGGSLFLANHGISMVCSNIHPPDKKTKQIHKRYIFNNKIKYEVIDAMKITYPDNHFDVVFVKSIFGYFNSSERKIVIDEIYRVLKPSGSLLFAENMKGSFFHQLARKLFVRWGKKWNYLSQDDLLDLFSKFNNKKIHYSGFLTLFFVRYKLLYRLALFLDYCLFFVPNSKKYVSHGYISK